MVKLFLESRWGDELSLQAGLCDHTWGRSWAGAGAPSLLWAVRALGCPHLPGGSERFCLKHTVMKTFSGFILPYPAPMPGWGKALLRQDEKFKKNPSLFDSLQTYFEQWICCQFSLLLILIAVLLSSCRNQHHTWSPVSLQQSLFDICTDSKSFRFFSLWHHIDFGFHYFWIWR